MEPLYTLLLCLPAALALIACGCGVALLCGPPVTQPTEHPTASRRWGRRSAARGGKVGWGTSQTLGRSGMHSRLPNAHKANV
jgi:hypothetical protein